MIFMAWPSSLFTLGAAGLQRCGNSSTCYRTASTVILFNVGVVAQRAQLFRVLL